MAIKKLRKVRAGNLHFSNFEKTNKDAGLMDLEDTTVTNAMEPVGLIDPEIYESGDLHFSNHDKTNRGLVKSKSVRARKLSAGTKLSAADLDDVPEGTGGSQNISTIDNDVDPIQDYMDEPDLLLENAQGDTYDEDLEADADEDDYEDEESDSDPEWDEEEDDLPQVPVDAEADEDEDEDDQDEDIQEDTSAMPIAEIRQVDDTIQNVAFVMNAGTLCVLKDTTVIASMSKAASVKAKVSDVYGQAAYHHLLREEAKKHGLMAALVANGFRTERLDLSASKVVAKTIKLEASNIEKRLTKIQAAKQEALNQSIAIAAVGVSRNFFNKVENPLRSALERELIQAGMKNPQRMLQRVFAAHGQGYIQNTLSLANKLSAMSEEVRDNYADALDMVNDTPEDSVMARRGITANDETPEIDDEDDGFEFDSDTPSDESGLTAALLRRPTKVAASQVRSGGSETQTSASAITAKVLRGELPLFTYGLNS